MVEKRRAAVFNGKRDLQIKKLEIPQIKDNELLIRTHAVGVCGSDVHMYMNGKIGPLIVPKGHIMGHEMSGDIVLAGAQVFSRKIGERVAIEPQSGCGICEYCRDGRYHLCKNTLFMGHPAPEFARREGAYSEYVKVKESEAFPIPDTVSYEEGALIEPFAVAMHALEQSGAKPGMDILILGAGTIGLCMVMAAKLYGIAKIYIFDNVDYRLQVAESMGAMSLKTNVENLAEMIKEKTSGHGVDIVLEASGAEVIYQTITYMVKNGGVICFVGMSTQEYFSINVSDIINRELKITSNFRYANLYPKIIKLIGTGNLQLKNLITHRFSLENINEAMLTTFERKDTCIKAIISM